MTRTLLIVMNTGRKKWIFLGCKRWANMKQISLLPKFANFCSVAKIIFASFLLTY